MPKNTTTADRKSAEKAMDLLFDLLYQPTVEKVEKTRPDKIFNNFIQSEQGKKFQKFTQELNALNEIWQDLMKSERDEMDPALRDIDYRINVLVEASSTSTIIRRLKNNIRVAVREELNELVKNAKLNILISSTSDELKAILNKLQNDIAEIKD